MFKKNQRRKIFKILFQNKVYDMSYVNNKTYTFTTSNTPSSSQFNQKYVVTNYVYAVNDSMQPIFYLGVVIQQSNNLGIEYPRYLLWVYNGLTSPLYVDQDNIFTRFFHPAIVDGIVQPPLYSQYMVYQIQAGNSIVHHMVFENSNNTTFSESMPIYRNQLTNEGTIVYNACEWTHAFRVSTPLYYTTLVPSSNPTPTATPFRPTIRPTPTPSATSSTESWWQRNKAYVIIAIIVFLMILIALIYFFVQKSKKPEVIVGQTTPLGKPPIPFQMMMTQ